VKSNTNAFRIKVKCVSRLSFHTIYLLLLKWRRRLSIPSSRYNTNVSDFIGKRFHLCYLENNKRRREKRERKREEKAFFVRKNRRRRLSLILRTALIQYNWFIMFVSWPSVYQLMTRNKKVSTIAVVCTQKKKKDVLYQSRPLCLVV
jgi:hypothetical protein